MRALLLYSWFSAVLGLQMLMGVGLVLAFLLIV